MKHYILIIDKGEVCEIIKGPFESKILAVSAGERQVVDDANEGFTCPVTWEVFELVSVSSGGTDKRTNY